MKTKILIVVFLFCVVGISGCGDEPISNKDTTFIYVNGWCEIASVHIDEVNIKYMDSIFSKQNNLIPQNTTDSFRLYYFINSNVELKKINPFGFATNIDFSKYTLIAARIITPIIYNLPKEMLYYNDSLSQYYYKVIFEQPEPNAATFPAVSFYYLWKIYPKLNPNYEINFETAFVYKEK